MSEPGEDEIRQHADAETEGPDPSDPDPGNTGEDVPREHSEDPAEG